MTGPSLVKIHSISVFIAKFFSIKIRYHMNINIILTYLVKELIKWVTLFSFFI